MLSAKRLIVSLMGCVIATTFAAARADETVSVCFRTADGLRIVQRPVPPGAPSVETALRELAAGPNADERAKGIFSAIPAGTTVNGVTIADDTICVDYSAALLADGIDDTRAEAVFVQTLWTLDPFDLAMSVRITVDGAPLWAYLPPVTRVPPPPSKDTTPPLQTMAGTALSGREISISPGHGRVWTGSSWNYERPVYCAPLTCEDDHNVDLMQFVNTYLTQDGAVTKVYRCLNKSYGNHSSGTPWWRMSAGYWVQLLGYPCSVYASSTGDCTLGSGASESSDSLRSRPLASDYDAAEIYISMHTNGYQGDCFGGSCPNGTCTYYDAGTEHAAWGAISQQLAQAVNGNIVNVIRNRYGDTTWRDRGALDANGGFAETRIPNRAAILIELAFHDSCDRDALYLQDNFFRSATTWAVYKGVCDYFGVTPTWDFYSDEYVSDTIPSTMNPGQSYNVSVTFRNRGVLWNSARSFRLGAAGDSDPFTAFTRVELPGEVGPGETCTFNFTMTAPTTSGTYVTDWRMLREGVTWFGPTHSEVIIVGDGGPVPPTITLQPTSQTVPLASTAVFTIQAVGPAPLSYQWQKNGADLSDGARISGATSTTLQITNVDGTDVGTYRCIVTNTYGSTTSNSVTLTVVPNTYMVESRPGGQNFANYSETGVWGDTSGKSTATGVTGGIGSRYGSTLRSTAGEKHAVFDADLPVAGAYEVFATWGANSNRRNPVLHRITHAGGTTDVNVDQATTANVWVSLGTYSFAMGTSVGRVDVNNLNIDESGSMYADAIKWEFRLTTQAPAITQQPAAQTVCTGNAAQFTVAASGTAPLAFRWQKNGANLSNGGHYSGVTTATLTVSGASADDAANYRCVVTNAGGSATSNAVALTVKPLTQITQHPTAQAVCAGGSVSFSVTATGDGALAYRWQKDGTDLNNGGHYSGATTPTLSVSNIDAADVATYACVVTAGCGSQTSTPATLTLKTPTTITTHPQGQNVCIGGPAAFQVTAGGEGTLSYQWQQDQADIPGATSPSLYIEAAATSDAGSYRCVVTGNCGSVASGTASLIVRRYVADLNEDCDVDLTDFARFQACFNGPNRPFAPACQSDADFDNDGDVDLNDFAIFQMCFQGPNRPPATGCPYQ